VSFPAVFFDRDGTLMEEVNYCADPGLVRLFPGTGDALRRLRARGFLIVIVTNQSGIGRGLLTEAQYHAVQAELIRQLGTAEPAGGPLIAASYFCPDAPPSPSPRRKPEPGMVFEAARDLDIDLTRSWFIGDKSADIECGRRAGCRTILVQTGYGGKEGGEAPAPAPDFIVKDAVAAAEIVARRSGTTGNAYSARRLLFSLVSGGMFSFFSALLGLVKSPSGCLFFFLWFSLLHFVFTPWINGAFHASFVRIGLWRTGSQD